MRRVAGGAVLSNRLMLPQEGAASFGMAVIARLVGGELLLRLGAWAAMRIVAIRAGNLAFTHRMMRWHEAFRPLFGVAGKAFFRLCRLCKNGVFGHVERMAVSTRDVVVLMLTALPVHSQPILMTGQTNLISFFDRRGIRS